MSSALGPPMTTPLGHAPAARAAAPGAVDPLPLPQEARLQGLCVSQTTACHKGRSQHTHQTCSLLEGVSPAGLVVRSVGRPYIYRRHDWPLSADPPSPLSYQVNMRATCTAMGQGSR